MTPETRTPAPQRVLDVRNLSKTYGSGEQAKPAMRDVTFAVEPGEFVSIVGPSGAGKTTLLKCLAGLLAPTSGTALFEGVPITEPPARMGLVFQDYSRSLFPWLSIAGNVTLPMKGKGIAKAQQQQRAAEALRSVGLEGVDRQYPWELSGGMQQRVALARAIAYQPDCLLMDEPFASVDAQTKFDLEDLILKIRRELDMTVVFVTHDIDEAVYISDRILALSNSPCEVKADVAVDLGAHRDQVRTRASTEFAALRTQVLELVRESANRARELVR